MNQTYSFAIPLRRSVIKTITASSKYNLKIHYIITNASNKYNTSFYFFFFYYFFFYIYTIDKIILVNTKCLICKLMQFSKHLICHKCFKQESKIKINRYINYQLHVLYPYNNTANNYLWN